MFSKSSNRTLTYIFAGLLIIAGIVVIFDSGKDERSFRNELVDIDTAKVTEILLYPKSQNNNQVRLFKDNELWKVNLSNNKNANVPRSKIQSLFTKLLEIKPNRLAARGESSWNEFEVDSAATRIKVFEGRDLTLDLLIGRFSFQQPRTMNTFVRLAEDTDVYEVEGFLGMTFDQNADAFRDGTVIKSDYTNWIDVSVNFSADSSYRLVRLGEHWTSPDFEIDSAKTENTLRGLSNIIGSGFINIELPNELTSPVYSLEIADGSTTTTVRAFNYNGNLIINSSQNPDAHFDASQGNLLKRVFPGRKEFVK